MDAQLNETVKTLLDTGKALVQPIPTLVNADRVTIPYYMTPAGPNPCPQLVFNDHAERPERIAQSVSVYDAESFCEYYKLFADASSRVAADETKCSVLAVLDYHEAKDSVEGQLDNSPRWGKHKLTLVLRNSPEWMRWTANNNKQLTQQEFAEFLEQNSIDIVAPSPAAMMEVARDLQATTEVEFGAGVRMQDGQVRFKYTETLCAMRSGRSACSLKTSAGHGCGPAGVM